MALEFTAVLTVLFSLCVSQMVSAMCLSPGHICAAGKQKEKAGIWSGLLGDSCPGYCSHLPVNSGLCN